MSLRPVSWLSYVCHAVSYLSCMSLLLLCRVDVYTLSLFTVLKLFISLLSFFASLSLLKFFSLYNCVLYHSCLVVMFLFLFIFYLSWLSSRFDIYNVLCYCYCYYLYCSYVFVLIFIFCCSVHVFIVFVSAFVVLVLCLCSYNNFFTCLVSVSAPAFTALVSCVIAFLCSCADVYGVFFRVSCQFRRL